MKIVALDLKYYGPFTNKSIDFGDENGLHLVYGPNEAGKSTTLRALHNALFGFDSREAEREAHVHDAKTLAIGISFRGTDGKRIDVVRSKGRGSKSLVYSDSGKSAPELVLPVADEDEFKMLFGIDYNRLVNGGRLLAEFKGDVGQAMLAAAGDTGDALKLIASLDERCESLYKERGSAPLLNKALSEYREAKKAMNASRLSPAELKSRLRRLQELKQYVEQTDGTLDENRLLRLHLDRLINAVPLAQRFFESKRRLEELGNVPALAADFRGRHTNASESKRDAEARQRSAESEQARLQADFKALDRKPAAAAIRARLEQLTDHAANTKKEAQDLPKCHGEKQEKGHQRLSLCQALGVTSGTVPALTLEDQTRIQNLSTEHTRLETKRSQMPARIAQMRSVLRHNEQELGALPELSDIGALRNLLTDIPKAKRSGEEVRKLKAQQASDMVTLQAEFAALPLWSGTLEELEVACVPLSTQTAGFEKRFSAQELVERKLSDEQNRLLKEKGKLQVELAKLEGTRTIPTEAELQSARQKRDELWNHVRVAWESAEWSAPLAGNYEAAVGRADELADTLTAEADAVVKKADFLGRIDAIAQDLTELAERSAALLADRQRLEAEWLASWPSQRVRPGTPVEMREWSDARKSILEKHQGLRTLGQNLQSAEDQQSAWSAALASMLQQPSTRSLPELVATSEARITAAEQVQQSRAELKGLISKERGDLEAALREQSEVEAQWQAWTERWTQATEKLPTEETPDPSLAQQILTDLRNIEQLDQQIAQLDHRIARMGENWESFTMAVVKISAEVGQEQMAQADPLAAFQTLRAAADAAVQTENTARELAKNIAHHARKQEEAQRDIMTAEDTLRALSAEAGLGDDVQSIVPLLDRHKEHMDLQQALSQDEKALRPFCGNKPFTSFLEEVAASDPDQLQLRLEQLEAEIQKLDQDAKEAREEHQTLKRDYDDRSKSQVVSAAASRRECAGAQIEEYANEYAHNRVKAHLLRKAIEQYRDKHQDPLLDRLSSYFKTLTCGRYTRVRIEQTDTSRFLLAIRNDEKAVSVGGMSDGTRDQLFLALRLAHVANHCAASEACPLILDDVLMAFDDARATAAMQALSQLAETTQVLLFTHHKHHVDLATETLGTGKFRLHELAA